MQEMGVLSLRDVMSFRVFHNALGLDLFSVISLSIALIETEKFAQLSW